MHLDSALELQDRIFRKVFGFEEIAAEQAIEHGFVATAATERVLVDPRVTEPGAEAYGDDRSPTTDIALGIFARGDGQQRGIAILVQNRRLLDSDIVQTIDALAKHEARTVFIGRQRASWPRSSCAPVVIGSSISTSRTNSAGTLGCYCQDNETGKLGILSNNHVIADLNSAPLRTKILQPGRLDGGASGQHEIASLARVVPLQFGGAINIIDAAFAELEPHGRTDDMKQLRAIATGSVLSLSPANPASATPGMIVHKVGRTTGFTSGQVVAVNVNNLRVNYRARAWARFDGQITVEALNPPVPFSSAGDSGSIVVDDTGHPIALLFAGSTRGGSGNVGISGASPISTVLQALNVSLV